MGVSDKYGTVITERRAIPLDEPVFIIRAQDKAAAETLRYYLHLCKVEGSSEEHITAATAARDQIVAWQAAHADQVKAPD